MEKLNLKLNLHSHSNYFIVFKKSPQKEKRTLKGFFKRLNLQKIDLQKHLKLKISDNNKGSISYFLTQKNSQED